MSYKILTIEDDESVVNQIKTYFENSYVVFSAGNLKDGIEIIKNEKPDLVLLDLILPDGNGLDLLKLDIMSMPTIILTTMDIEEYHIEGLGLGAKDYLIKPVSMPILAKHIEIRLSPKEERFLSSGGLTIDTLKRIVKYEDTPITLTATEFNILLFLFKNSDSYHTAQEIYDEVYGSMFLQSTTIKMHLSHLRNKLLQAAPDETFISTSYGKGYRFLKV